MLLWFLGCSPVSVLQGLGGVLAVLVVIKGVVWLGVFSHDFCFVFLFVLLDHF